MNKIYKLVYSKTLNSLVAVSEIATRSQAGSNQVDMQGIELDVKSNKVSLNKLALTFVVSSLFSALPLGASAAPSPVQKVPVAEVPTATSDSDVGQDLHLNYESKQGFSATNAGVVADTAHQGNLSVKYVQNVPVVNINAAKNGVSDNRFSKFSTDTGVVFNNAKAGTVAVDSTLLKEKLAGNPNLKEAARTILAQVTGNDKSVIKGALEIIGSKADLILINPNGIDLNGVNLLNTKEFTASTADVSDSNDIALKVNKGELNVNGTLTSEDVDVIRLIAKAVKIKAQISSRTANGKKADIYVGGGRQNYNLAQNKGTAIDGDTKADTSDKVAISGDVLGSMYGKNVNFIVSETGVGVNYDGLIISDQDLHISADGKVVVKDTYSKGTTTLESKSDKVEVKEAGKVRSQSKIDIKGNVVDTTKATLHATTEVKVKADNTAKLGDVTSDTIDAKADGYITTAKATKLLANHMDIYGGFAAKFDGKITANHDLAVSTANPDLAAMAGDKYAKIIARRFTEQKLYNTKIQFNDEVKVIGEATLKAGSVLFEGHQNERQVHDNNELSTFKFGTINLNVNADNNDALSLTNGKLATNNLNLTVFQAHNLSAKPLVSTQNGLFTVYQTASLDLTKPGDKTVTLNSEGSFKHLATIAEKLNGTLTKVKVNEVNIGKNQEVNFDRAITLEATGDITNQGIIDTKNSFSLVSGGSVDQSGLLFAKGNLVINAAENITLSGATFSYVDTTLQAKAINQSGDLNVGGNLDVTTDSYKMYSKFSGKPTITNGTQQGAENYHYHSWRKDKYELYNTIGKVDTSDMNFDTVETNVLGNLTIKPLTTAEASKVPSNERFKIENGRLYVGGDVTVDGSVEVKTTTFKVPVADLLKHKQNIYFMFTPTSLINTNLANTTRKEYSSIYDFFDQTFLNGWEKGEVFYWIDPMQKINTFKEALRDETLNKVISSVFGADWRAQDYTTLASKWRNFKDHSDQFNIAIFAPNSEVMSLGNFTQKNGSLFVGSDLKVQKQSPTNGRLDIHLQDSSEVLVQQKMQRKQSFDTYASNLGALVKKANDGTYVKTTAPDWEKEFDFKSTINKATVADNATLGMVIVQQFKDKVGGFPSAGRDNNALLKDIFEGTKARKAILDHTTSSVYGDNGPAIAKIDGKTKYYTSKRDLYNELNNKYDYIDWVESATHPGKYEPVLRLKPSTVAQATNFDQVAASLSAVKSVRTENNSGITVNHGSINSRHLDLTSNGDINLTSLEGQNSLNADETIIRTEKNLFSAGNLNVGDLDVEAKGDVTLTTIQYFNTQGDLANQAKIKAEAAAIKAKNLEIEGALLKAKEKAKLEAEERITLKSVENKASRFDSIADKNENSGRQITQQATFVQGAEVQAKNLEVKAGGDLEIESSKLKAEEKADISAATLTATARADTKEVKAIEEKTQLTFHADAQFGGYAAGIATQILQNRDVNGNLDQTVAKYGTDKAGVAASGAPVASAGITLSKQTTTLHTISVNHVNNELNAQDLNIEIQGHAELGNTNINTDGNQATAGTDFNKTATIKAASISQTQAKDIEQVDTQVDKTSIGVSSGISSSAVDALSHTVSAARAGSQGMKLDGTYAATVVGDVLGLATRDLVGANAKLEFSQSTQKTTVTTESDSRNKIAGSLTIETTGDTQLKAIDGKLKDLNVTAKNFTLEEGQTKTQKAFSNHQIGASVDMSAGLGITGASGGMSGSISASETHGTTVSTEHNNSVIEANNVNIKVEDKVTISSSNVFAHDDMKIKAKEVDVISKQDIIKSESSGKGFSASVGGAVGGAPVPFGSIGGYIETHKADKALTASAASLTAGTLTIEADKAKLVGAVVDAMDSGELKVKTIETSNLDDHAHVDGGKIGVNLGTNKTGSVIAGINGGRDRQIHSESTLHSTVGANIKVAQDTKVVSAEDPTKETKLNRNVENFLEIKKNDVIQETQADITYTSNLVSDVKNLVEKVGDAVANSSHNVGEAIGEYLNGSDKASSEQVAGYDTHHISGVDCACGPTVGTTAPSTQQLAKSYAPTVNGAYPVYRPHPRPGYGYTPHSVNGVANPYGGGFGNSGYGTTSSAGRLSSDFASTVSSYSNSLSSSSVNQSTGFNSSHLANNMSTERKATEARKLISNIADFNNVGTVQDVKFKDVLSETRKLDTADSQNGILVISGEKVDPTSSSIDKVASDNSSQPEFDFGSDLNKGPVDIPNVVDLGTVNFLPGTTGPTLGGNLGAGNGSGILDIPASLQPVSPTHSGGTSGSTITLPSNSGSSSTFVPSNNGGVGTGTGTGFGSGTSSATGTGVGSGSGNNNGINFGGGSFNAGNGATSSDLTSSGGNSFVLDFPESTPTTSTTTSNSDTGSVQGSGVSFNNGGDSSSATHNTVGTDVLTGSTAADDGSSTGSLTLGGASNTDKASTSGVNKPSTEKPAASTELTNPGATSSSTATAETTDGSSTTTAPAKPSDSSEVGASSTSSASTVISTGSKPKETATVINDTSSANLTAPTPADGNAKIGDTIKLNEQTQLVKYQVGDLACYVVANGGETTSEKGTKEGFKDKVAKISKARQTLFSTYSKGISQTVGEGGVICVPTDSKEMKTDYNVVQSYNDIPIVRETKEKDLEAVVVTETKLVKVKVVSDKVVRSQKVIYQPTKVNVTEVQQVKDTLKSKGIDASKVMILGVKGNSANSIVDLIKNTTK